MKGKEEEGLQNSYHSYFILLTVLHHLLFHHVQCLSMATHFIHYLGVSFGTSLLLSVFIFQNVCSHIGPAYRPGLCWDTTKTAP